MKPGDTVTVVQRTGSRVDAPTVEHQATVTRITPAGYVYLDGPRWRERKFSATGAEVRGSAYIKHP